MTRRNVPACIVLPTLNEAEGVGQALAALANQTHSVDRIYLLDGGSTDGTVKRAKNVASDHGLDLDVTERKDGNIGWACHIGGMKAAKYILDDLDAQDGVIIRTDADSILAPSFVATAVNELSDPDVTIMGAQTVPMMANKPCGCAYHAEEKLTKAVFATISNLNPNPKGRAQAFRARDFREINGYCLCGDDVCNCDPDWYEDAVLTEKLKTRGRSVFSRDTYVKTELPSTTLSSVHLWGKHQHWRQKVRDMDWLHPGTGSGETNETVSSGA